MADSSFDCVVIGSGPGGYVAAIRAAQLGMKTAVIEKDQLGGRCLNYACIPAKAVLRVADVLERDPRGATSSASRSPAPTVDFAAVGERRQKVISTLTGGVGGLLKKNGIEVIEGVGTLTADGNVTLRAASRTDRDRGRQGRHPGHRQRQARRSPAPRSSGRVIGTEEAWALSELPKTLVVVGAGASGTEIASATPGSAHR